MRVVARPYQRTGLDVAEAHLQRLGLQLRKFARRNKTLVAGVSGVIAALLVGTVVSILFALRAEENARVAEERERIATHESYRARIAAAVAAVSRHDVEDAERQLEAAGTGLSGSVSWPVLPSFSSAACPVSSWTSRQRTLWRR